MIYYILNCVLETLDAFCCSFWVLLFVVLLDYKVASFCKRCSIETFIKKVKNSVTTIYKQLQNYSFFSQRTKSVPQRPLNIHCKVYALCNEYCHTKKH